MAGDEIRGALALLGPADQFDSGRIALIRELASRAAIAMENARLYTAVQEADRRKNEFLAMLAHELRNPLAPICNALEIMRLAPGDQQSVLAATEMMQRQVGEMVRLVDDLLDVNRISRGTIELRRGRVELASVVRHAVEAGRPAMESAEQALTITLPPQPIYLNADPTRLAQVVGNLLNNAHKYTDKGGRIELVVSVEWQVVSEEKQGAGAGSEALKLSTQHSALSTQHSALSTQHSALATRHSVCRHPSARQRHWHRRQRACPHFRNVRADRYLSGAFGRRLGPRSDAGEKLGGVARRHSGSSQCRCRSRQ
jgi:hypothetical protein